MKSAATQKTISVLLDIKRKLAAAEKQRKSDCVVYSINEVSQQLLKTINKPQNA